MAPGYKNLGSTSPRPFQLYVLATLLLNFPQALPLSRERQGRILNGPARQPVTDTALSVDSWVQATGNAPSLTSNVVRPSLQDFWPSSAFGETGGDGGEFLYAEGNVPAVAAAVPPPPPSASAATPFQPDPLPSLKNHRVSVQERVYNNSKVEVNLNVHRIAITLPPNPKIETSTPPANGSGTKKRKRVNLEKYRECVFFHHCPKAECFHFSRFGQCKTGKNEVQT